MRYSILLLVLACAGLAHADAYKCLSPSGQVFFSDTACDRGERFEKVVPTDAVSDPAAARSEVERQRDYAEKRAAERERPKPAGTGMATLPDYSSPPPSFPPPRPVSPSSTTSN